MSVVVSEVLGMLDDDGNPSKMPIEDHFKTFQLSRSVIL